MNVTVVIDRFEGDKAVLLVGEQELAVSWPRVLLPEKVIEGDILDMRLLPNVEATRQARQEAEELLRQVQQK